MKSTLIIIASGLFLSPLWADDELPKLEPLQPTLEIDEQEQKAATVPEPNTLLVAGIGSLAIMLFAVRRK